MKQRKQVVLDFIKKETVLSMAVLLAVISCFFVKPDRKYLAYPDYRVLAILFCLMAVMAGLQKLGLFERAGCFLLKKAKNQRQLELFLIFLCFFCSMFMTNDVALLTFVPFALLTLKMAKLEQRIAFVVIFQTIAANLGSMFTPIGNPQNLYLYNCTGMNWADFLLFLFPYVLISGIMIFSIVLLSNRKTTEIQVHFEETNVIELQHSRKKLFFYIILFGMSILVVAKILPYPIVFAIVVVCIGIIDRDILKKVDYSLLFTFFFFFIFIGNMERIPFINELLQKAVTGHEMLSGILLSQFISNVPAALLISGFTKDYRALLLGVDFGGLGTLIASMASLISYKFFVNAYCEEKRSYLLQFSVYNVIFLIILVLSYVVKSVLI